MILVIDIGNTSTTVGTFRDGRLVGPYFFRTAELGESSFKKLPNVSDAVICSVVPKVNERAKKTVKKTFGVSPLIADHTNIPIEIKYPRPFELGADRLVNAFGALGIYKPPFIVIDLGTATTFDYVDPLGRYIGGPIVAGPATINTALYLAASKLPNAPIKRTEKIFPRSTVEAIQIGVYQGYIGLVERLLKMMLSKAPKGTKVIATGGFAKLLAKDISQINKIDTHLTLKGLCRMVSSRLGSL